MARRTQSVFTRDNLPLAALLVLLAAAFLFGGGSRGDITSLIILRPLAIACLAVGLYCITGEQWRAHAAPLLLMTGICAMIALHLVPLPPFLWQLLPGRAILVRGDEIAEIDGAWRPLALVPYRGWDALWAMAVPAAAMVLAAQIASDRQFLVLRVVTGLALLSALLGLVQAVSGYDPSLYTYRVTNPGSPVGLFANRNHQAALMCIALPMLALFATRAQGSGRMVTQALCGALALILVLVTLATGSRAGLAFLLLAGAVSSVVIRHGGEPRKVRTSGKPWLVPAVVGGGGLLVAVALAIIFSRAAAIDRVTGGDGVEENRFQVWRITAETMLGYQPVGSGVGSFIEVFATVEPSNTLGLAYWNHAHNDWLEWILEGGIPAIVLILAALFVWVRAARAIWRRVGRREPQVLLLALTGASTILILGLWSLVDYPLRVPSLAALAAVAAIWMTGSGAGGSLGMKSPEVVRRSRAGHD